MNQNGRPVTAKTDARAASAGQSSRVLSCIGLAIVAALVVLAGCRTTPVYLDTEGPSPQPGT